MNGAGARRLLAIVAVFVLVVSLIAWHSHRTAAMRRAASKATAATATAAPRRSSNADDVATTQALERPSAPTIELIARDPLEAANAWQSRAWSVLYAQNRKEYGDDVARLLQLPYNEAWDELLARSKNGDIAAGAALMHIANICKLESTRGEHASDKIPPPSRGYKNLPDMWKPFVDRLGELHDEDHQRITHCEGVGDVLDLATAFETGAAQPAA